MPILARVLAAMVLAAAVAGCGPVYKTTYSFVPPQSERGRDCTRDCQADLRECSNSCTDREDRCRERAREDAHYDYRRYVEERRANGQKIERSESSFDRSYQCPQQTCKDTCGGEFRTCYQACGGKVIPHTACTSFCDQDKPAARQSEPPRDSESYRDRNSSHSRSSSQEGDSSGD